MLETALLLVLAGAPAMPAPATPVAVLQDDEKPDKRPEIKEMLDALGDHIKLRGKEDQEAVGVIDKLVQEFENSGAKDRAAIVKGLGKCLKVKRTEDKDGVRDNKLYLASAVALGMMGPESVKPLTGWIDHKQHNRDMELQRRLILALGKTQSPKAVKPLTNLLKHHRPELQGAAAEALGGYEGLKEKLRKELFEAVLKQLAAIKATVDSDTNLQDLVSQERYNIVKGPMVTALQQLSGHDERDPDEWQRW